MTAYWQEEMADEQAEQTSFRDTLRQLPASYTDHRAIAVMVYRESGYAHAMETLRGWLSTMPAEVR